MQSVVLSQLSPQWATSSQNELRQLTMSDMDATQPQDSAAAADAVVEFMAEKTLDFILMQRNQNTEQKTVTFWQFK